LYVQPNLMYCWAHSLPIELHRQSTSTKLSSQIWPIKVVDLKAERMQVDGEGNVISNISYVLQVRKNS